MTIRDPALFKAKILSRTIATALVLCAANAQAESVRITVENLAPADGVFFTPVWMGFHDGSFDVYDLGAAASPQLEAVAEDGDNQPISDDFLATVVGGIDTVATAPEGFAGAPVFDPGDRVSLVLDLDPSTQRYLSYASMLLPSNDAFFANADPRAHELFDAAGNFTGPISFLVLGEQVRDAGTEANTEMDAAFFNQSAPNTGEMTTDPISVHPGFNGSVGNPDGTPVVFLGGTSNPGVFFDETAADFTRSNYRIARITVEPAALPVRVTVSNLQASEGLFLTPLWLGFHDGDFDLYDIGAPASEGLERIAEDGSIDALSAEFATSSTTGVDLVLAEPSGFAGAPLFDPGTTASTSITLDPAQHRYFSYASMVVPSNDAFIANGNPRAFELFDEDGAFTGPLRFVVAGDGVRDAGTESNTEMDAAFFDQSAPNTGVEEGGTVAVHPGFNGSVGFPDGQPMNILGGTNGPGFFFDTEAADFTRNGARLASVTVERAFDGSLSGSWYNPQRSGEGLMLELVDEDRPTAVVSFYTYAADGSGEQVWLIGSGPLAGDTAIVDLMITQGTAFGDDFDADLVERTPWGQVRIQFLSDRSAILEYDASLAGYGSGEIELQRLTAPLIGSGR